MSFLFSETHWSLDWSCAELHYRNCVACKPAASPEGATPAQKKGTRASVQRFYNLSRSANYLQDRYTIHFMQFLPKKDSAIGHDVLLHVPYNKSFRRFSYIPYARRAAAETEREGRVVKYVFSCRMPSNYPPRFSYWRLEIGYILLDASCIFHWIGFLV